ncbi:MAG TPA: proton-conducting transporter membrane subunit [Methanocorpusculum sp.]|nr:proton-conducting transporter membrane subunit [Methanocorpusculum sp.]
MYTPELLTIFLLLLVPLAAAVLLAVFKQHVIRSIIVTAASVVLIVSSIYLAVTAWSCGISVAVTSIPWIWMVLFIAELVIAAVIIGLSIKYKKPLALVLGLIQLGLLIGLEVSGIVSAGSEITFTLNNLSLIMVLIIGIIGSLICVYALGYMKDYAAHNPDIKDRRRYFFVVLFLFLTAMFGIVLSGNLMMVLAFWEVTTLCSFLLIGYSRTGEAITNSFRAVWMNLIGGIAFTGAVILLCVIDPAADLLFIPNLLAYGNIAAITIPLALLALAGITKAAQLPFSTWLTGAMVAPTPVSALLHSSTMVKAGVFLLIVLAPLFHQTWVGIALAFVGAFTFLATSALAISQSNAKRVLAYSTIANLGLIVACAGIGTPAAITAAILLTIFHAVAKCLLFLCVGAVEHKIGSRDIEDMDALLIRQPLLAVMMVVGIAGMYLAPFGMLISKWAAIEAFLSAPFGYVFIAILAFGSALTVFFWTKWLGKLFMRMAKPSEAKPKLNISEGLSVTIIGILTILTAAGFPLITKYCIAPFAGDLSTNGLFAADTVLMCGLMFIILLALISAAAAGSKGSGRIVKPYLNGRAVDSEGRFLGSLGVYKEPKTSNYYLEEYVGEKKLLKPSQIIAVVLIVIMLVLGICGVLL